MNLENLLEKTRSARADKTATEIIPRETTVEDVLNSISPVMDILNSMLSMDGGGLHEGKKTKGIKEDREKTKPQELLARAAVPGLDILNRLSSTGAAGLRGLDEGFAASTTGKDVSITQGVAGALGQAGRNMASEATRPLAGSLVDIAPSVGEELNPDSMVGAILTDIVVGGIGSVAITGVRSAAKVAMRTFRDTLPELQPGINTLGFLLADEAGAIFPKAHNLRQARIFAKAKDVGLTPDDLLNAAGAMHGERITFKGPESIAEDTYNIIERRLGILKDTDLTTDEKMYFIQAGQWPEGTLSNNVNDMDWMVPAPERDNYLAIKLQFFGISEKQLRNTLGEPGGDLADRMLRQQNHEIILNNASDKVVDDLVPKVTPEQNIELQRFMDGKGELSDETLHDLAPEVRRWFDETHVKAVDEIGDSGYLPNYFPRHFDEAIADTNRKGLIEGIMKEQGITSVEAVDVAKAIKKRSSGRKAGPIENSRSMDMPEDMYNMEAKLTPTGYKLQKMDIKDVMKRYAHSVNRRISEIKEFGKDDEMLYGLSKSKIIERMEAQDPELALRFYKEFDRLKKERFPNPLKARVDAQTLHNDIMIRFAGVRDLNHKMNEARPKDIQSVSEIYNTLRTESLKGRKALPKGDAEILLGQAKKLRAGSLAVRTKTLEKMRESLLDQVGALRRQVDGVTLNDDKIKALREEAAEIVAANNEQINKIHVESKQASIMGRLDAQYGVTGSKYAKDIFDRQVGTLKTIADAETSLSGTIEMQATPFLRISRNLTTALLLNTATIANMFQTITTVWPELSKQGLIIGGVDFAKAVRATFLDGENAKAFASSAGAIKEGMTKELLHVENVGVRATTSKISAMEALTQQLASWSLNINQFSRVEQGNNITAAVAGKIHAERLVKIAGKNKDAARELKRMGKAAGMHDDDVLRVIFGDANDEDLRAFGYGMARLTQFRGDAISSYAPMFTQSDVGKFFAQFKNFLFGMSRFVVDNMGPEVSAKQRIRFIATFAPAAYLSGTAVELIREDLIRETILGLPERKEDKWTDEKSWLRPGEDVIDKMSLAGAFGILGSMLEQTGRKKVIEFGAGPNVTRLATVTQEVFSGNPVNALVEGLGPQIAKPTLRELLKKVTKKKAAAPKTKKKTGDIFKKSSGSIFE